MERSTQMPAKYPSITFRLSKETLKACVSKATSKGLTVSDFVRMALIKELETNQNGNARIKKQDSTRHN